MQMFDEHLFALICESYSNSSWRFTSPPAVLGMILTARDFAFNNSVFQQCFALATTWWFVLCLVSMTLQKPLSWAKIMLNACMLLNFSQSHVVSVASSECYACWKHHHHHWKVMPQVGSCCQIVKMTSIGYFHSTPNVNGWTLLPVSSQLLMDLIFWNNPNWWVFFRWCTRSNFNCIPNSHFLDSYKTTQQPRKRFCLTSLCHNVRLSSLPLTAMSTLQDAEPWKCQKVKFWFFKQSSIFKYPKWQNAVESSAWASEFPATIYCN